MRVVAWLSLLTGASAFYGPAVRVRRGTCMARAAPAVASLCALLRGNTSDVTALRELDELQLSYVGWQEDAAAVEEIYVNEPWLVRGRVMRLRRKQQVHDGTTFRHGIKEHSWAVDLQLGRWWYRFGLRYAAATIEQADTSQQLVELKPALTYQGWQKDAAELHEAYIEGRVQWLAEDAPAQLAKMRRKQQVHERQLEQEATRLSKILNAGPTSLSYTDAGTLNIYIPPRARRDHFAVAPVLGVMLLAQAAVPFVVGSVYQWTVYQWTAVAPIALPAVSLIKWVKYYKTASILATTLKQNIVDPAVDTTLTIGQYEWKLRRTVAGVVTCEVEGATDTLRSADTKLWSKTRHECWCGGPSKPSEMVELRLNRADEQAVLIDAELTPDEVASLAIKVNAHLQGLASEIDDGDCV